MDRLAVQQHQIPYGSFALDVVRIVVNEELIAQSGAPLKASDSCVYLRVCEECYATTQGGIPNCDEPDVEVRQYQEIIVWYLRGSGYPRPEQILRVWCFQKEDYERVLSGNSAELPKLSTTEINAFFDYIDLPRIQTGLYTIPDVPSDPQGWKLLESIRRIVSVKEYLLSNEPSDFRTITIGIDADPFYECGIDVGLIGDRCSIRLIDFGVPPIWITSDEIQCQMSRFVSET